MSTSATPEEGTDDGESASETASGRRLWLSVPKEQFSEWRAVRPFFGGVLLALGGLIIAGVLISSPMSLLSHSGRLALALVAAIAMVICGVLALAIPGRSGLLGVVGLIALVVSFIGLPFAAFIGVLLSLLGGNLCYAWQSDADTEN